MDKLDYLLDFLEAVEGDARIGVTHVGVYAALLQIWRTNNFENPFYAFSHEVMRVAKLSASKTYNKCIRQLSEYGYLRYEPSFNRFKGSKIYFLKHH